MLKIGVISFVRGFLVIIIAEVRGWGSFSMGSGLLTIFGYERATEVTQSVIGTGTLVISLLAGILNAGDGAVLWSRTSSRR